jgi:hypothetical protein
MAALDLSGQTFGRLKAVKIDESRTRRGRGGRIVWECLCDCGKTSYVQANNLRGGQSTTCGGASHKTIPDGNPALYRKKFERYKSRAALVGFEFSLSLATFAKLVRMPCHYCGDEGHQRALGSGPERTLINGIDRKDSAIGYIESNCLPCCHRCNEMKMDENYESFLDRMKRILVHLKRI